MKVSPAEEYITKLEEACCWLGVSQGRTKQYIVLLKELANGRRNHEHLMSSFEVFDLDELHQLWRNRVERFPGLKDKLRKIIEDGPLLSESENTNRAGTIQPRNNAFSVIISGRLLEAGFDVMQVEGCRKVNTELSSTADCTIKFNKRVVNLECKRSHSENNLTKLARNAKNQLENGDTKGIVALDCSVIVRNPNIGVFICENAISVMKRYHSWLERDIYPRVHFILSSSVIGLIMYIRVPTMIKNQHSQTFNPKYRMHCGSTYLIVGNRHSSLGRNVMTRISRRFKENFGPLNVRGILSE